MEQEFWRGPVRYRIDRCDSGLDAEATYEIEVYADPVMMPPLFPAGTALHLGTAGEWEVIRPCFWHEEQSQAIPSYAYLVKRLY